MPEALIVPVFFITFFATLAYWIHVRSQRAREQLQAQMDLQTRVLERFDSPQELASFLQTEGGRKFIAGVVEERTGWAPAKRILFAIQTGVVATVMGIGFYTLQALTGEPDLIYPATILLFLGLGFLIAATLSYTLSKSWGLVKPRSAGPGPLAGPEA